MTPRPVTSCLLVAVFTLVVAHQGAAEDVYFVKSFGELELTEGDLPAPSSTSLSRWRYRHIRAALQPRAAIDGPGEAFVAERQIAVRAVPGQEVVGSLLVHATDDKGMRKLRFRIPARDGTRQHRREFLRIKKAHYANRLNRDIAGAAWFRHQLRLTNGELGDSTSSNDRAPTRRFFGTTRRYDMENTFALLSGGRAVSENLQLDRELPRSAPEASQVSLPSITGITVREFDWQPLIAGALPAPDPLAKLVPADQHVLLFPSFLALTEMIDHAREQGTPILRAADPRAEDAQTLARYQRQLCLPLGQVERLFGGQLVSSVALTGGDPYFRTGTDLAVLFEAKDAATLQEVLKTRMALSRGQYPLANRVEGEIHGVKYEGLRSADRVICSYHARLGTTVVVTNSLAQLDKLVRTHQGGIVSLATLPEYVYFRTRYARGHEEETAFLVISDPTIRRWCGPRWRIATSRRTRAAAVMSELQAGHLDALARGQLEDRNVASPHWLPEVDRFTLTSRGPVSDVYGTLEFQTPILEMEFDFATQQEATFYRRWRDGYQRNWSNFFDPIAVRFHATPDKLATDLTVMPLITGSQYSSFVELSKGAQLDAHDGDPHAGTLFHGALSINTDSSLLKRYTGMARIFAPQIHVDPLSWIGNSVAIYADKDAFWMELAKLDDPDALGDFMRNNFHRLPVAVRVEVRSGLKLTAFLAGVRAYIDQAAPGMTVWEVRDHNDQPYVKVSPSAQARSAEEHLQNAGLYYSASGDALIVTFSEPLLRRALDRQRARRDEIKEGNVATSSESAWIGDNMCARTHERFIHVLDGVLGQDYQSLMRARSWGNIPILNEWKRRYPDRDPLQLHEQLWHRRLVCPGGGEYRWNDSWQTMESTIFGHPGQPQAGPRLPAGLRDVTSADFGVSFEDHGLRARMELTR